MCKVNFKSKWIVLLLILGMGSAQVLPAQSDRNAAAREMRDKRMQKDEKHRKTETMPCQLYDTDEEYTATGVSRINMRDLNTAAINKLLRDCQEQLKMKIKGRYQAVVRDYVDQMDLDAKSAIASHIESAGEMIIDRFLDDTKEDCREQTEVDDAGYIYLYMGILVKKADLVDKLVDELTESKNLSQSEKDLVRKNEDAFRKSAFKVFEQDGKTQNNTQQE
jgi:hypothetical protein